MSLIYLNIIFCKGLILIVKLLNKAFIVFKVVFVCLTLILFILLNQKDYFIEVYKNKLYEKQKNISEKEVNKYLLDKFNDQSLYIHESSSNDLLSHDYIIKSNVKDNITFTVKNNLIETTDTYDADVLVPIMNRDQEFLSKEIEKCLTKINFDTFKDGLNTISRDSYDYSFFSEHYNEYHTNINPDGFRELYQNDLTLDMDKLIIKLEFTHTAYNATYSYDYIEKYIKNVFENIQLQGYKFNKFDFNFENAYYVIKDGVRQKSKICYGIYNLTETEILGKDLKEYIKNNVTKKLLY